MEIRELLTNYCTKKTGKTAAELEKLTFNNFLGLGSWSIDEDHLIGEFDLSCVEERLWDSTERAIGQNIAGWYDERYRVRGQRTEAKLFILIEDAAKYESDRFREAGLLLLPTH